MLVRAKHLSQWNQNKYLKVKTEMHWEKKRKTLNATWIFHCDEFRRQAKNSVEIKILLIPNDGFWYLEPNSTLYFIFFTWNLMLSIRFLLIVEKAILDFTKGSELTLRSRSNGFPKGIASLVSLQNQRSTCCRTGEVLPFSL